MSEHFLMNGDNIDVFLYYLQERFLIYKKKEIKKLPRPWTEDPILHQFSFTNIKREWDRTSRWAIENWYTPNISKRQSIQLINCAVFRWFGTSDFAKELGYIDRWVPEDLIACANHMMSQGRKVFTGAYVITNGGIKGPKQEVVVYEYLAPFWNKIPRILEIIQTTRSWASVASYMRKECPGFGGTGFMTKEVLLDTFHTSIWEKGCVDQETWSPVGPGANRGLNRLMNSEKLEGSIPPVVSLQLMRELQEIANKRFHGTDLPGLTVSDIQFSLCEYDKYMRVKLGQGRPRSFYGKNK